MSYLSDSHGDLIETHKIIPIVILEIPPVAHIRAWMRVFYVRLKWEMAYKWPLNGAHESNVDENWKIFNFLNRFYLFSHLKVKKFGTTLEKLVRVLEDVFQILWVSLKITPSPSPPYPPSPGFYFTYCNPFRVHLWCVLRNYTFVVSFVLSESLFEV